MRKVALYNPKAVFFDMPLALLSVSSGLDPQKYDVRIVDGRVSEDAHAELREACKGALCLGVTSLSGAPLTDALSATRMIRAAFPDLPIIWGGWHPSLFPKDILEQESAIDIAVYGQGETTFLEIIKALEQGKDMSGIKGIAWRRNGQIYKAPPRPLEDQNALPPVNYDLIDVEKYYKAKGSRQFDYISSTGCFFRCTFCADPFVFKRRWTSISAERMGEELAHWHGKYQFDDLNFQDETFFTYRDRCLAIADQLITRNLGFTWAATMRADQGARLSFDDFKTLKKSGLRRLLIGVESGSQEMMDWLKKDIKVEQVLECAARCKELDIGALFPFIVGFPNETAASVQATIDRIIQLRSMSPKFQTPIFYFQPYPGTAITAQAVADGFELPTDIESWAEFDYVGSGGGPWVDPKKFDLIERFKFYSRVGWSQPSALRRPIQALAKARCRNRFFKFPVEQKLVELLRPKAKLS